MTVAQIYELMNAVTASETGMTAVLAEDLSNVVDFGNEIQNVMGLDNYVKSLVDHVGRVVFVDRVYAGRGTKILKTGWEFGSIMEKISARLPEAQENESFELSDGASYDPNIFTKPTVSAKFFNNRVTFEIPMSITEMQVKSSFSNATQLNSFVSMIYTAMSNSMTIKTDALISRTINSAIAATMADAYTAGNYTTAGNTRAVNLLALFNTKFGTQLDAEHAITNADFIKFASYTMANYIDRMKVMSTLFNIDGAERFTPMDRMNIIMLSDFKNAAGSYLNSDTFHDNYVALPQAETVPFWQGSGTDFSFSNTSKINVKLSSGTTVEVGGILAIMHDFDAVAVCNENPRTTSNYNPKAEFYNIWRKWDSMQLYDSAENFVVFFVA